MRLVLAAARADVSDGAATQSWRRVTVDLDLPSFHTFRDLVYTMPPYVCTPENLPAICRAVLAAAAA